MSSIGPQRTRLAHLVTAAIVLVAFVAVGALSDRPLGCGRPSEQRHRRAAVAIRDHVVPFQKWGSRLFTLPALESAYDEVHYVTARWPGDGREQLLAALRDAIADHEHVDLFLLAHANWMIDWIATLEPEQRARIRLVYDTGCGDARHADEWLRLGVGAFVGHRAKRSTSPVFYLYFLRRWVRGDSLAEAVAVANQKVSSRLGWLFEDDPSLDPRAELFGTDVTIEEP